MTDVSIGLYISCGCLGSTHRSTCDLVTRLPIKTTAYPGRYIVQLGTIHNVERPEDVYSIKYPVCYQFDLLVQSPLFNKIDDYGESLAYSHAVLPQAAHEFVSCFIGKITALYDRPFSYNKNYKLFIADNVGPDKCTFHLEPFSLKVGGFCMVESSEDVTVDFMNKRKYLWSHSLSAVDGAALNNQVWLKTTAYYQAKVALHKFLWLIVIAMFVVPLVVHSMKDHDAECLKKCCDQKTDCREVRRYWGDVLEFNTAANASNLFDNFGEYFNLSDFRKIRFASDGNSHAYQKVD